MTVNEMVFVRCASHRARNKLTGMLRDIEAYYPIDFNVKKKKGTYLIPANELKRARGITGVTKCRDQNRNNYGLCW